MRKSGVTPIVNEQHFTDARAPTLGSPMTVFNPGAKSTPFPNGPPKYVQPKGKRPSSKGLTNKRITSNV